jgi:hypothetical protein
MSDPEMKLDSDRIRPSFLADHDRSYNRLKAVESGFEPIGSRRNPFQPKMTRVVGSDASYCSASAGTPNLEKHIWDRLGVASREHHDAFDALNLDHVIDFVDDVLGGRSREAFQVTRREAVLANR